MNKPSRGETPHTQPSQEYIFGAWSFSIDQALEIIEKAPRPTVPLPVNDWANAFDLGGTSLERGKIPLLGPGPFCNADYAMTADLSVPVLIATLVDKEGVAAPLFIDGTHRLYRAYQEGVPELPAYVLTAEESLAIRSDRYLD